MVKYLRLSYWSCWLIWPFFNPVKFPEIVFHNGCIVRDVAGCGTSGTIYRHCQMGADNDDEISQGVNYWRWIQIKIVKNSETTT